MISRLLNCDPIGADKWVYKPYSGEGFKALWRVPVRGARHFVERMVRGYSIYDMWNADEFLADLIAAAAYWHFVNGAGYPHSMSREEWFDILLEIRDGFQHRNQFDAVDPPESAWQLLRENFKKLWD